jgi:hypothetical protein
MVLVVPVGAHGARAAGAFQGIGLLPRYLSFLIVAFVLLAPFMEPGVSHIPCLSPFLLADY